MNEFVIKRTQYGDYRFLELLRSGFLEESYVIHLLDTEFGACVELVDSPDLNKVEELYTKFDELIALGVEITNLG